MYLRCHVILQSPDIVSTLIFRIPKIINCRTHWTHECRSINENLFLGLLEFPFSDLGKSQQSKPVWEHMSVVWCLRGTARSGWKTTPCQAINKGILLAFLNLLSVFCRQTGKSYRSSRLDVMLVCCFFSYGDNVNSILARSDEQIGGQRCIYRVRITILERDGGASKKKKSSIEYWKTPIWG